MLNKIMALVSSGAHRSAVERARKREKALHTLIYVTSDEELKGPVFEEASAESLIRICMCFCRRDFYGEDIFALNGDMPVTMSKIAKVLGYPSSSSMGATAEIVPIDAQQFIHAPKRARK